MRRSKQDKLKLNLTKNREVQLSTLSMSDSYAPLLLGSPRSPRRDVSHEGAPTVALPPRSDNSNGSSPRHVSSLPRRGGVLSPRGFMQKISSLRRLSREVKENLLEEDKVLSIAARRSENHESKEVEMISPRSKQRNEDEASPRKRLLGSITSRFSPRAREQKELSKKREELLIKFKNTCTPQEYSAEIKEAMLEYCKLITTDDKKKEEKERELINNFRNASNTEEQKNAAEDIVIYWHCIAEENAHFLKLSSWMVINEKFEKGLRPIKSGNDEKDAAEVYNFIINLKNESTFSLSTGPALFPLSDIGSMGIHLFGTLKKDDYKRSHEGLDNFLDNLNFKLKVGFSKARIKALQNIIETYPLVMHLINSLQKSFAVDHHCLLNYGTYFYTKDKNFPERWLLHQSLKTTFAKNLEDYMLAKENDEKDVFYNKLCSTSLRIAGIYYEDLNMMPEGFTVYGDRTKKEALNEIESHIKALLARRESVHGPCDDELVKGKFTYLFREQQLIKNLEKGKEKAI